MPSRATRDAQHLVFTDHRIRRKRPESDPTAFILPPNSTIPLRSAWPEAGHQWLAAARIEAHHSLTPQEPLLVRGVAELLETAERETLEPPLRRKLIEGLISQHRSRLGLQWIGEEFRYAPNDVEVRLLRGCASIR